MRDTSDYEGVLRIMRGTSDYEGQAGEIMNYESEV